WRDPALPDQRGGGDPGRVLKDAAPPDQRGRDPRVPGWADRSYPRGRPPHVRRGACGASERGPEWNLRAGLSSGESRYGTDFAYGWSRTSYLVHAVDGSDNGKEATMKYRGIRERADALGRVRYNARVQRGDQCETRTFVMLEEAVAWRVQMLAAL